MCCRNFYDCSWSVNAIKSWKFEETIQCLRAVRSVEWELHSSVTTLLFFGKPQGGVARKWLPVNCLYNCVCCGHYFDLINILFLFILICLAVNYSYRNAVIHLKTMSSLYMWWCVIRVTLHFTSKFFHVYTLTRCVQLEGTLQLTNTCSNGVTVIVME